MSTVRDGVVYYVGTEEEVAHHARPLAERMEVRIVTAEAALERATPRDVTVFFNEYFERFRAACIELVARGCPTLYAVDGILEWRNSWEFPGGAGSCLQTMRPVLAHKVACIGRSQARTFESWGNLGKCEVVGIPRFDALSGRRPRARDAAVPFRILVMTAKTPGYTVEQWERTRASLADLIACLLERANSDAVPPIEPI